MSDAPDPQTAERHRGEPDTPLTCHEGGCACGAVRLRSCGTPWRVGVCHCLTCRKTHGAPFSVFLAFPAKAVTLTRADGSALEPEELGVFHSSAHGRRFFCRQCGAPVYALYDHPDEIEVYLGSFDEPSVWRPTYEVWTVRRESWVAEIAPPHRQFPKDRPGGGHTVD
jgi:hypothetical protein